MTGKRKGAAIAAVGLLAVGGVSSGSVWANWFKHFYPHARTTTTTVAPPVPGSANVWVDTDGGTCTRNSPAAAYVDAAACGSVNAGYLAAHCGDTVLVKAGTYGGNAGQVVNSDASKVSCISNVTVQAASGASVTLGDHTNHTGNCDANTSNINFCGPHLTLKDITLACTCLVREGADNVTFDNVTPLYTVYIDGVVNFVMKNSTIGPIASAGGAGDGVHLQLQNGNASCSQVQVAAASAGCKRAQVTLDHDVFKDITKTVDLAAHTDCFQTEAFLSLTITNSTFTNCADNALILGGEGQQGQSSVLLIENNFIGAAGNGNSISMSDPNLVNASDNWQIDYNSMVGGFDIRIPLTARGNILSAVDSFHCTTFTNNSVVLTYSIVPTGSVQCGATNTVASGAFGFANVNADPIDLHIGAGSPACGVGDPSVYPALDIDGASRVSRTNAGADGVC